MLFFLFLLGSCVGTRTAVLQPLPAANTTVNLIQMAKKDPHALIKALDGAPHATIESIINILEDLVTDAQNERKKLVKAQADAKKTVNKELVELNSRVSRQKRTAALVTITEKAYNIAVGVYNEAKLEHDEGKGGLEKEIRVFNQVLVILRNLLAGQPQPKGLLALGSTAEGLTYQKLIEKIKADPVKLQRIISILEKLLAQSTSELDLLVKTLADAKKDMDRKKKAWNVAIGENAAAVSLVETQEDILSVAEGKLNEANKAFSTRNPVLNSEEALLKEVIAILLKMLE